MATLISKYNLNNSYADSIGSNTLVAQGSGATFVTSPLKLGSHSFSPARATLGYGKKTTQSGLGSGNIDLSIGCWVYWNALAETDAVGGIGVSSANADQNIWFTKTNSTTFTVDLGSDQLSFTVSAMSTGVWYWVWITYTAATKTTSLYLNNTLSSSQAHVGNLALAASTNFIVGADIDGNNSPDGYIDDFRIYSGVTSATERATIYNGGVGTEGDSATTTSTSSSTSTSTTTTSTSTTTTSTSSSTSTTTTRSTSSSTTTTSTSTTTTSTSSSTTTTRSTSSSTTTTSTSTTTSMTTTTSTSTSVTVPYIFEVEVGRDLKFEIQHGD